MLSQSLQNQLDRHILKTTKNPYCCDICNKKFDLIHNIPLTSKCGHTACKSCANSTANNSYCGPLCPKHTTWVPNYTLITIIEIKMTNKSIDCFCDITIQNKMKCMNKECQNHKKISCIRCFGLIHEGCNGDHIGNNAVFYLSKDYNENNLTQNFEFDNIILKWGNKFNDSRDLSNLAISMYRKYAYTKLEPSVINANFLRRHVIKEIKHNVYYFIDTESDTKEPHNFMYLLSGTISQMDNDVVTTNSNGILKNNFGFAEKTINVCFPKTIINEIRVFVFNLFERLNDDNTLNDQNNIYGVTSKNGTEYKFSCYVLKNSTKSEYSNNSSCYFIESHFRQITIFVDMQLVVSINDCKHGGKRHCHKKTDEKLKNRLIKKRNK